MRFRVLPTVMASLATLGLCVFASPVFAAHSAAPARAASSSALSSALPATGALPAAPAPQSISPRLVRAAGAGSRAIRPAATATATATGSSCATEPACPVAYQGGPVQHSPHVYLVLWGPDWPRSGYPGTTTAAAAYAQLYWFYNGLGQTTADSWSTIMSQYTDSAGGPVFGHSVLVSSVVNPNKPANPLTPAALASEAAAVAAGLHIPDLADAQVVIASQSGTCFSDGFAGNPAIGCTATTATGYCAWHSAVAVATSGGNENLAYTNLPFQLDAGTKCREDLVNGKNGSYDGFTIAAGAEYADTITDPRPTVATDAAPAPAWVDTVDTVTKDTVSGGEIAGKCAPGGNLGASAPKGDLYLPVPDGKTTVPFPFAVQSLWSNKVNRCVLTASPKISLATPGTQNSTIGKAASLQLSASTNTGTALAYAATGLPPGLAVNRASGRITGTPESVTAATWRVTVSVSDPLGYAATRSASFNWLLNSPAGAMKGYAGKCVDNTSGRTTNGNKIQIWTCNGGTPQRITFTGNGELHVNSHCITAVRFAYLEPCTGIEAQTWTRLANGEYVLKSSHLCLTDPSNSQRNGTQLSMLACRNTANQHWSLP